MSRGTAAGRVVRSKTGARERCLALSGKGAPGSAELEEAIEAVMRAASALRLAKRRTGHEFKPPLPEVRLRAPGPGARGGSGWTVFLRVPVWVSPRDAREAAAGAAEHAPIAKNIRLSPVSVAEGRRVPARPGRDHQPGQIRRRRTGPQHRARELR
jgi:hypothetical protein